MNGSVFVVFEYTGSYDDTQAVALGYFTNPDDADKYVADKTQEAANIKELGVFIQGLVDRFNIDYLPPLRPNVQIVPIIPREIKQGSPAYKILLEEKLKVKQENSDIHTQYQNEIAARWAAMNATIRMSLIKEKGFDENDSRLENPISSFFTDATYYWDEVPSLSL